MLQYLSEGTGDTGELDISSCEQTIRRSDASDIPSPERERAGIFPTGSPFLISSNLSWEDRPKLAAGASGAAALLTCCALHPFDLIKTRMQVAAVSGGAIPSYGSTRRAITRIYKQEGLRGLWKGVGVTAAASSTSWTCFRYIFDRLGVKFPVWREALCGTSSRTNEVTQRTSLDDVASGLVAGVLVTFLTHPLWLAKARMEMQAKEAEASGWPQFRNGFNCIVSAVRGGVRESYRGVGPALALAPHAAIQIAVYEQLKRSHNNSYDSSIYSAGLPAVWGAISKFAALTLTYPLQVLRSRQQVHNTPYANLNFLKIAIRMIKDEGLLSLFSGYWVHTQRACLQSALMFFIYEGILVRIK